jgi:tRNA (adenine22-N1)-methyltransferase
LRSGRVRHVIASDIKRGPLNRARETAEEYGINTGLELVLADGISHLKPQSVDAIIIAGMGGETIARILAEASWITEGKNTLILQPMTKTEELIRWLSINDMSVSDATLAEDEGEIYLILLVEPGKARPSACELYVPRVLVEQQDPLLKEYLNRLIRRITFAVEGIKSSKDPGKNDRLKHLETALKGLMNMRGEIEACQP